MSRSDLSNVNWRKSSLSGSDHNCVEVAFLSGGAVAVRNSNHPDAGTAVFTPAVWTAFIDRVKSHEFDS
ncbi:DUF397 domain-containing protein [Streptosporangium sp. NPDC006930]|uniref:DUF397 domain-containing protein n=1 Tax=unclassified Streptosporangium TaxID=2632669 RepID=UPI0034425E4E